MNVKSERNVKMMLRYFFVILFFLPTTAIAGPIGDWITKPRLGVMNRWHVFQPNKSLGIIGDRNYQQYYETENKCPQILVMKDQYKFVKASRQKIFKDTFSRADWIFRIYLKNLTSYKLKVKVDYSLYDNDMVHLSSGTSSLSVDPEADGMWQSTPQWMNYEDYKSAKRRGISITCELASNKNLKRTSK